MGTPPEEITTAPSPDPIAEELSRHKERTVRSEEEKAAFSLQKNAERVRELGLDPTEILGLKKEEKGTVMTVEMYREIENEKSQKTALQLANEIQDEQERELTKTYLRERIKPSGNAEEDLRFARLAVNSVKNSMIASELGRKAEPKTFSSSPGVPPVQEKKIELTKEELSLKQAFKLSDEEVLKARG